MPKWKTHNTIRVQVALGTIKKSNVGKGIEDEWGPFQNPFFVILDLIFLIFYLIFYFLAMPYGIRGLRSLTRAQTHAPCRGRVES